MDWWRCNVLERRCLLELEVEVEVEGRRRAEGPLLEGDKEQKRHVEEEIGLSCVGRHRLRLSALWRPNAGGIVGELGWESRRLNCCLSRINRGRDAFL